MHGGRGRRERFDWGRCRFPRRPVNTVPTSNRRKPSKISIPHFEGCKIDSQRQEQVVYGVKLKVVLNHIFVRSQTCPNTQSGPKMSSSTESESNRKETMQSATSEVVPRGQYRVCRPGSLLDLCIWPLSREIDADTCSPELRRLATELEK